MEQEILTPTEKLKALREVAKTLSDALGKVVTYDDETTEDLLQEAEGHAVAILQIIHDGNREDIMQAVLDNERQDDQFREKEGNVWRAYV